MKKAKLFTPLLLSTTTLAVALPLSSCACNPLASHISIDDAQKIKTMDADGSISYTFTLDNNYTTDTLKVELTGDHSSDLSKEVKIEGKTLTLTIKCPTPYQDEAVYNFDVVFKYTTVWTETIQGFKLSLTGGQQAKKVIEINNIIKDKDISTMSALLALLLENEIDLESLTTINETDQWVWDSEQNVVFVMNANGEVVTAPSEYTINQHKTNIWKMVSGTTSVRLNSASNIGVTKDAFSPTSQYSQYLRSDATFASKDLTFCSGLDTGVHTEFNLTFKKDETITDAVPAIINTSRSSLTVESSLDDITHYGNLKTLTITELPADGVYTEYGNVDARVILNSGAIVAAEGSTMNDIVITSNDVVGVKVESTAVVGTVVVTKEVTKEAKDLVDSTEAEVKPDTTQPKQDPSVTPKYDGGFGTKNSPYAIGSYQQLKNCREDVNGSTLSENNMLYFKLIADIDMSADNNWTPIGTKTNQFYGTFDGNGYTITNLKISADCPDESKAYGWGLFGYTNGTRNNNYDDVSHVWQDKHLVWDNITEDKYTTVIKNVTLDKVNINITGEDGRCVGGLIGISQNTFVSGCQVKSGIISGCKGVGGLIGTLAGSICYDCIAGDDAENGTSLKVDADVYNVAGLIGCGDYKTTIDTYTYNAIIDSSTGSNCKVTAKANVGGYVGGILSYCDYCHGIVVDNCVNNSTIESINTSTNNEGIAGIIAYGYGRSSDKIANCTNNGSIVVSGDSKVGNAAGIIIEPGHDELIYNCVNNGKITANATNSVAGIAAGCNKNNDTDSAVLIDSCSNTGEIKNTLDESKASDICDAIKKIKLVGMTFKNVQELNKTIARASSAQTEITFENCDVTDKTGSIVLPTSVSSITSDKSLSENISVNSMTSLTVNVPDQNITVTEDSDCNIISLAKNNTITIEANGSIKSVAVSGEESTIVNNGTVKRTIALDGASKSATNNGTCANVRFGKYELHYKQIASNAKTFINNGTITGLADTTETNNNVISIHTLNSRPDITLKNFGTIKYQNNGLATPADLIHYDASADFILECYENSKIITDKQNFFSTTSTTTNCYAWLKWKEGYTVTEDGTNKTFDQIKTQYVGAGTKVNITVEQLQ